MLIIYCFWKIINLQVKSGSIANEFYEASTHSSSELAGPGKVNLFHYRKTFPTFVNVKKLKLV